MNTFFKFAGAVALFSAASQALADNAAFVPEPGALPLVGLAIGVAALVMRRKK